MHYVLYQELIMCRGEYLTLYSPVIYDCAEIKWLPFREHSICPVLYHKSFIAI